MSKELLLQLNELLIEGEEIPPHIRNLITQLNKKRIPLKNSDALKMIVPAYLEFQKCFVNYSNDLSYSLNITKALDQYFSILKSDSCKVFIHQSDFISSVIPEVLHRVFRSICATLDANFIVSSQKDVITDCTFDAFNGGRLILKKKKMDVSIVVPSTVIFNGTEYHIGIPVVAIEVKTNVDKNMLSGIEQSVESLKNTFPSCLYYNISELADFSIEKQNYATTKIDEIFILRKQKRSEARKPGAIVKDVDENLILEVITNVMEHLKQLDVPVESLKERMGNGKLINKRNDTFE